MLVPPRDRKLLILPALAGVLSFACFPEANQGYLAWIALVPLVVFTLMCRRSAEAFFGGFACGAIQFFSLLPWIPRVLSHYGGLSPALAWLLYALMTALLACYPASACLLARLCMNASGERMIFVLPLAWVAMEYSRNYTPFGGFPWLLAGYSQTNNLAVIQIADLAGVYGVSFLVLWVNTAIAWFILRPLHGRPALWVLASSAAVVLMCVWYGRVSLGRWQYPAADHTAALLQGNLSLDEPEAVLAQKYREGYVNMADRLQHSKTDLLVLPESPSPSSFQYEVDYRSAMQQLARRFPFGMVLNNISYSDLGVERGYFNSAFFIGPDGEETARYDKIHLVPFGEYIPLKRLFSFAQTITKDVSDFQEGREYAVAQVAGRPVNAIICFEAIFPELSRRFAARGSELIINLTNDAWYGDSSAPYQHLAMARWRAVETRRYLLRATNSGISAIVEPTGRIQSSTPLFTEDICIGRFAFLNQKTAYTRSGDVLPPLCAIITLLAILGSLRHRFKAVARSRP